MSVLAVAVPAPLPGLFDYLPPDNGKTEDYPIGSRLLVPFGPRTLVAIVIEHRQQSSFANDKLKPAIKSLDLRPLLSEQHLKFLLWAANYYQHPIGDALQQCLPSALRQTKNPKQWLQNFWYANPDQDPSLLKRSAKQKTLAHCLSQHPEGVSESALIALGFAKATLSALAKKHIAYKREQAIDQQQIEPPQHSEVPLAEPEQKLTQEQLELFEILSPSLVQPSKYQCFLLEGVTGSGKTEVYLQAIAQTLQAGKQTLILVPEIGLTPQTLLRFQNRFQVKIAVLHSNLTSSQRLQAWMSGNTGEAQIVIGTRSAIFAPLPHLGMIVVDEEHDSSFKQQDGYRYSARDLAVIRAHRESIPLILGSATPSLESLYNAQQGRYQWLKLRRRANGSLPPRPQLIDLRNLTVDNGISQPARLVMAKHLENNKQVLVFLNRRGYAPVLMCHQCGWTADCDNCDTRMTLHRKKNYLHCHHCNHRTAVPNRCPSCGGIELIPLGAGTQRSEDVLKRWFPETPVLRIDRDSVSSKTAFEQNLKLINSGQTAILVGTQMLAKGHHFPAISLVLILDIDAALFSADFRAPERLAQLVLQVSGRAGREGEGQVLLQTHHPEHVYVQALAHQSYSEISQLLLNERKIVELPPYGYLAVIRSDAKSQDQGMALLQKLVDLHYQDSNNPVQAMGPIPSPVERRAGRYRANLLLQAPQRGQLHRSLRLLGQQALQLSNHNVRCIVDIDPLEIW